MLVENSLPECNGKPPPPVVQQRSRAGHLADLYHLPRSSSNSSLEHAIPLQRKAATFELRGRHSGGGGAQNAYSACSSASVGRNVPRHQQQQPLEQETSLTTTPSTPHQQQMLALEYLLQCGRREPVSGSSYMRQNGGHNADTEDSSDAAGGMSHSRAARILSRHQGGRCSVPTVGGGVSAAAAANSRNAQLASKMNALYLGSAMRGLPLGSEASHFQNERFYLENGLRGSGSLAVGELKNYVLLLSVVKKCC